MTYKEMKDLQKINNKHFFSDENIDHWKMSFAGEPNELNMFISFSPAYTCFNSFRKHTDYVFALKIFRIKDSSVDGIIYKGRNFTSRKDAEVYRDVLTKYLIKQNPEFVSDGVFDTHQDFLKGPTIMEFISKDNKIITVDLDKLGNEAFLLD